MALQLQQQRNAKKFLFSRKNATTVVMQKSRLAWRYIYGADTDTDTNTDTHADTGADTDADTHDGTDTDSVFDTDNTSGLEKAWRDTSGGESQNNSTFRISSGFPRLAWWLGAHS